MVSHGKFLNQREDIVVVGNNVFLFLFLFFHGKTGARRVVEQAQLVPDFQFRNQMRALEIRAKVAILGNISK
jgi:hypothetical protein